MDKDGQAKFIDSWMRQIPRKAASLFAGIRVIASLARR